MTGEHAEDIGALKTASDRATDDVKLLFASNEKRKKSINNLELKFADIKRTVESTEDAVTRAAKQAADSMDEIRKLLKHMDGRVTALEEGRFDWVKVFQWLGTRRGAVVIVSVSAMLIGAIFPDAREWISSLVGHIATAGVK